MNEERRAKLENTKRLRLAMEKDEERKANLEKMVATTLLMLALDTEIIINIILYPKLNSSIGHYEAFRQPWDRGFIRYMPSLFYPASIVFFQLHRGIVSLKQALATPSSRANNSKILGYLP